MKAGLVYSVLKTALGFLVINIAVESEARGRCLGTLNIPGTIQAFINIDIRALGIQLLYAHVALV